MTIRIQWKIVRQQCYGLLLCWLVQYSKVTGLFGLLRLLFGLGLLQDIKSKEAVMNNIAGRLEKETKFYETVNAKLKLF